MTFDKTGIEIRRLERLMRDHRCEKVNIGCYPGYLCLTQGLKHTMQTTFAVIAPHDQFRDQRVIMDGNGITLPHPGIHPHIGCFSRKAQVAQAAGGRQETVIRVLRIDARFQGVAVDGKLILACRQPLAGGDPELPFDQVLPRDQFGHRVFDLKTGVHFHEIKRTVRSGDELGRACPGVIDGPGCGDCGVAHCTACFIRHAGRRGLFQHFLVAALDRAVPFKQVYRIAMLIAEDLNLDMPGLFQVFFQQHLLVTERAQRFPLCRA